MTTTIDQARLDAFMGQAVVDLAASFTAPLVRLPTRRAAWPPRPPTPRARAQPTDPAAERDGLARSPHMHGRRTARNSLSAVRRLASSWRRLSRRTRSITAKA